MSTDWGFRCETCSVDSPTWLNHGQDALRQCFKAWPHVKKVRECSWIEVNVMGAHEEPLPFDFLAAHDEHRICLINEYGKTTYASDANVPRTGVKEHH